MSSRVLRKLQREQEQQKQLQANQHASEDENSGDEQPIQPKTVNAFDMLNNTEEQASADYEDRQDTDTVDGHDSPRNENEGEAIPVQSSSKPKSKQRKKNKKARKKAGSGASAEGNTMRKEHPKNPASLDEIDLALKSLSTHPPVSGAIASNSASHETFPEMYRLLAIESKHLNVANEMKRLFGNVVLQGENDEPGQARRRGRVQHLDLSGALAGRNSPVSRGQGLAGLALRRNVFIAGKEEWPKATSGGLGMELVEKLNDGTTEYRFVHSTTYQDVQRQFETCVESLDPQRLIHLLQFNRKSLSLAT